MRRPHKLVVPLALPPSVPSRAGALSSSDGGAPLPCRILSGNHLAGSLPELLGIKPYLTTIDLANNVLSAMGTFQTGMFTSLSDLILSGNQLTGSIPVSLGNLAQSLQRLVLNDNQARINS